MKYLKKYNENIDFDDIDEEEYNYSLNVNIGDSVMSRINILNPTDLSINIKQGGIYKVIDYYNNGLILLDDNKKRKEINNNILIEHFVVIKDQVIRKIKKI
jgi:hypothetical protein